MLISPAVFKRLCRARARLEDESEEAPSIAQVAREVRLSRFHFIRRFRALFGVTPHQLRTRARLERATSLLGAGRTVTETCVEVGFSSLASFSELFARRIGVNPSSFRRRPPAAPPPGCLGLMAPLPKDGAIFEKRPRHRDARMAAR